MGELITGMMWFDNNPKTSLIVKVEEAATYFRAKYGAQADMCMVNRATTDHPEIIVVVAGGKAITVRPHRSILPGHLWIGVAEKEPDHTKK